MGRKSKLLISAVACALPLAALAMGGVLADTVTSISGLVQFHQVVVDTAVSPGYVFYSGGGSITVTDLTTGNAVTTLDSGGGVAGIALSADGSTLYAALTQGTDANSVAAITVSTITPTGATQTTYPLAPGDVPYAVAVQSGKVWVSYNDTSVTTNPGAIGAINLTANPVTFEPATAPGAWSSPPDLATDPSNSGVLVAVQGGISPAMAATYDTTADPATSKAAQASLGSLCSSENQVAVVPGGQQFIVACGSPVNENVYNISDLSAPASQLGTGPSAPAGVAIDANGTIAVGTSGSPSAIYVYKSDGTLLNVFTLPGSMSLAATAGLAWEDTSTGAQLAAVEQTVPSGGYSLQVFDQPTVTVATAALTAPSTAVAGTQLTLTGSLTLSTGLALTSPATVTITRTGPDGQVTLPPTPVTAGSFTTTDTPPTAGAYSYTAFYAGDPQVTTAATSAPAAVTVNLNTATMTIAGPASISVSKSLTITGTLAFGAGVAVPAGTEVTITRTKSGVTTNLPAVSTVTGGSFTLTDTPPAAGTYTYAASYAATSTTAAATASRTVSVVLIPVSLGLTTGATTFTYEPTIRVTAHLGATYKNRTVSIYGQSFGSKTRTLLKTGPVDSHGNLTITYRAPHSTTFSAVFSGDAHYKARTVTRSVIVRAKVSESISGYYATKSIGGTVYRLFHRKDLMHAKAVVAPNKHGECVKFEVWEFFSGSWHFNVSTSCVALSQASQALADFAFGKADLGFPYRVRADYMRGSDTSNQSADSPWLYFEVTV